MMDCKKVGKSKTPKAAIIVKARKICELYKEGNTIASCCEAIGVKYNTFQQWAQPNLSPEEIKLGNYRRGFVHDVHDLYKEALKENNINYKSLLKDAYREALLRRIAGYTYTETTQKFLFDTYGNKIGAILIKTEKHMPPDAGLLIFIAELLNIHF
jgi:hypothetical protein